MGNNNVVNLNDRKARPRPAAAPVDPADVAVARKSFGRQLAAMPKACVFGTARALKNAALSMTGAVAGGLANVLWAGRRRVLFVFGLGALAMLVMAVYQGINHWREPKLLVLSIAGFLFFLGVTAIYDGLAHSMLKLARSINGGN